MASPFQILMKNQNKKAEQAAPKPKGYVQKPPLHICEAISNICEKLDKFPPTDMKCDVDEAKAILTRFSVGVDALEKSINAEILDEDGKTVIGRDHDHKGIMYISSRNRHGFGQQIGFDSAFEEWDETTNRTIFHLDVMIKHIRDSYCQAIQQNVGWNAWTKKAVYVTSDADDHLEQLVVDCDRDSVGSYFGQTKYVNIWSCSCRNVNFLMEKIALEREDGLGDQLVVRVDKKYFTVSNPPVFAQLLLELGWTSKADDGDENDPVALAQGGSPFEGKRGQTYELTKFTHVARVEMFREAPKKDPHTGVQVFLNNEPQFVRLPPARFNFSSASSMISTFMFLFHNKDAILRLCEEKFPENHDMCGRIERFFDEHFEADGKWKKDVHLSEECKLKPEMVLREVISYDGQKRNKGVVCITFINPEHEPLHFPVNKIMYGTHASSPLIEYVRAKFSGRLERRGSPSQSPSPTQSDEVAARSWNRFGSLSNDEGDGDDEAPEEPCSGNGGGPGKKQWKKQGKKPGKKVVVKNLNAKKQTGSTRTGRPKARRGESADGEAELEYDQAAGGGGRVSNHSGSPTNKQGRPLPSPEHSQRSNDSSRLSMKGADWDGDDFDLPQEHR